MKYTQKSFTVGGSSKAYSDNFERTFRREPDPAPTECKRGAPRADADSHDGAELVRTYLAGCATVEVYRCTDCGREWEV